MNTMKAIVVNVAGGPDVLQIRHDYPKPSINDDRILIKVKAFGLNRAEVITRSGGSGKAVNFPKVIGIECVGIVEEVGRALSGKWAPGDIVMAAMGEMGREFDGSYAEYALLPAKSVSEPIKPRPDMKWSMLGAIPEAYLTAHGALTASLNFQPGQTLLIRGASSSVGLVAASLAKNLFGASYIIGTTRASEKVATLKAAGIDLVLVDSPSSDKVSHRVRGEEVPESIRGNGRYGPTHGGVDAVLEFIGTDMLSDSFRACKNPGGTVCILGGLSSQFGQEGGWNPWSVPSGVRLTILSTGTHGIRFLPLHDLLPQIESGNLWSHVDRVFSLDDIREAHRYMEANKACGKIVCVVGDQNSTVGKSSG